MKKLFTLAAGALIGLSASLPAEASAVETAQVHYTAGAAITNQSQLQTGKYFIFAYSKGVGKFVHPSGNANADFLAAKGLAEIPEGGTTDASYVYTITVNNGTFNITTSTGLTFPIKGDGKLGKGNIRKSDAIATDAEAAEYTLSSGVTGQSEDFTASLFYVAPKDVMCDGQQTYLCTNGTMGGDGSDHHIGYWSGTGSVAGPDHHTGFAFYPVIEKANNYYLIQNKRTSKYVKAHSSAASALSQITPAETDGRYDTGALWYFVAASQATAVNGYTAVNICNPLKPGQTLANFAPETWSFESTTWYISDTESTHSNYTGFTISKQAAANAQGWNSYDSTSSVGSYRVDDGGSKWAFVLADDAKVTATLTAITAELDTEAHEKFNALKTQGNLIAAMTGLPDGKADAWTTAIESLTDYSEQNFASLKTAYGALVDGLHMMFNTHLNSTDWICQNGGNPWCYGSEGNGSRIFTLKNAGGEGFYLFNEYTHKYLVHPTGDNVNAAFNADVNHASVYNIDMYSADATNNAQSYYGIYTISGGIPSDRTYLNTNANHGIYRWFKNDSNSSWRVTFATEEEAATEDLEGAKHPAGYTIGTSVGQYHFTAEFTTALNNATSATTAEEKRTVAATLRNIATPVVLNEVLSGYYHIRNVGANKLLTSDEVSVDNGDSDRLQLIASGNLPNTIWYYNASDDRLVAFANGLCLGKFDQGNNDTSWATVLNSDSGVGDVTFTACGRIGAYSMFTQGGGRRIFGNTSKTVTVDEVSTTYTVTDAGGGDQDNARWTLEPVTWLPMPYDENVGYLTIYSPAPLYMTDGRNGTGTQRVKPYTGTISGDKLVKTEITGTTIPANTPVLLEFLNPTGGSTPHVENGHIFVEVAGPAEEPAAVAAQTEAAFGLAGSIYATAKTSGTSYYLVDKPENSEASFVKEETEANVPGFASHLEVTPEAGATAPASFLITEPTPDSITEIEGAANNGKQVIYDLQGRRVQRASKGLYIINGVKTLVK